MNSQAGSQWDDGCDVIVIGSGVAGLAAAIEAGEAGAEVIVIEKMKVIGGNTRISDGALSAPMNFLQQERGVEDSVELFIEDITRAGSGMNHPGLVRIFAEKAAGALEWLRRDIGVRFLDRLDRFGGHSVARTVTLARHCGAEIIKGQKERLDRRGIDIRNQCCLQKFLTDDDGRVVGVEVRDGSIFADPESGISRRIWAKRGVVLATGGYGADVRFRSMLQPNYNDSLGTTNHRGATAEALTAALRLGALPLHLSQIQLGPWSCADERGFGKASRFASYAVYPAGILVDPRTGLRIVNEWGDRRQRAEAILQSGGPCLGIVDARGAACDPESLQAGEGRGRIRRFNTIEDIAGAYGCPVAELSKTVERYNHLVESGMIDEFGKYLGRGAAPLKNPPYHVLRLWPKVHYTPGGIAVSENCRVIDLEGRIIQGLFGAGEVCGGVHGAGRLGGCALSEGIVFGRIAGRNAAGGNRDEEWK